MAFSGPQLRANRDLADWSQTDLAKRVGITKHEISLYENRHRVPKLDRMQGLAEALGIRVDDLLDDRNVPRV